MGSNEEFFEPTIYVEVTVDRQKEDYFLETIVATFFLVPLCFIHAGWCQGLLARALEDETKSDLEIVSGGCKKERKKKEDRKFTTSKKCSDNDVKRIKDLNSFQGKRNSRLYR